MESIQSSSATCKLGLNVKHIPTILKSWIASKQTMCCLSTALTHARFPSSNNTFSKSFSKLTSHGCCFTKTYCVHNMTRQSQRIFLSRFFQSKKKKPHKITTNIILQSPTKKSRPKAQSQSVSRSLSLPTRRPIYTHKVLIKRHRIMLTHNIIPFPSSNNLSSTPYSLCLSHSIHQQCAYHPHTHIPKVESSLSLSMRTKKRKIRSNRYIGGLRLQPGSLSVFWVFSFLLLQLGSLVIQIFRGARA
jgi:hypothetical protein